MLEIPLFHIQLHLFGLHLFGLFLLPVLAAGLVSHIQGRFIPAEFMEITAFTVTEGIMEHVGLTPMCGGIGGGVSITHLYRAYILGSMITLGIGVIRSITMATPFTLMMRRAVRLQILARPPRNNPPYAAVGSWPVAGPNISG